MEKNLQRVLTEELKSANAMLLKYEEKLLASTGETNPQQAYLVDRVKYWSGVADTARQQLFSTSP